MEPNFKNFKPTLSTPTKQGKQVDTYFKKQMKTTGMSLKENGMLNEKEESLKKKIFKLDKMETLVHTDENLSKVFNDMKEDASEKFGYHWNETILNIIFNDYVLNSPKYLQKYKNTRAKQKTRRGEEGIAQLEKDINTEKEVRAGAEERKQDLMGNEKEKVDELFGFGGTKSSLPTKSYSKNDTYFIDPKKNKLVAHIPYKSTPEERQAIIGKYVSNPNYKQISWFDAVNKGIQGVPNVVSDGSYDQMKAELDKKYARQGGIEAIPALAEDTSGLIDYDIPEWALSALINGDESGLSDEDSQKLNAFVQKVASEFGNANFMLNDIEGEDNLGFKYSNDIDNLGSNVYRLYIRPSKINETDGASDAGAYTMGLDAQNGQDAEVADKTYQNETTTSASSGQYSGKAIWSKDGKPAANKPAWHGGKILETVVNGDVNYLVDASAFKKYLRNNELTAILNEEFSPLEEESHKEYAQRMLNKFLDAAKEDPAIVNDNDFKSGMEIWKERVAKASAPNTLKQSTGTIPTMQVAEHHLDDRESKIQFILSKSSDEGKYTEEQLDQMSDDEIDSLYLATEKEMGISEQPDFEKAIKSDLENTGNKVSGNESTDELEGKEGLFKDKWNDNNPIDESAGLSVDNLAKWASKNVLYATSDPSQLIRQYAEENGTTIEGLRDKAKFYASNAMLFPNGRAVKDVMLDLIYAIDDLSEGFGGDPEVGEDEYIDSIELNDLINKEKQGELEPTSSEDKIELQEKAVSKKQQKFMGMVHAAQKGKLKNPSSAVEKAAENMTDKEAKDFASTKHKGLPEKKKITENIMNKMEYKNIVKTMLEAKGKSLTDLNQDEKKNLFESADLIYVSRLNESMIDDQPDSMINNSETSMVKSMDSDELNKEGQPIAGAAIGGVQEDFETDVETTDDSTTANDASKFREKLRAQYGVDSVSDLSNFERAELMKSMNFGAEKPTMDFDKFEVGDKEKQDFKNRDEVRLNYLAQNADRVNDYSDFARLAKEFKNTTGENFHHPMAILASIQALPDDSSLKQKLTNVQNVLQSTMKESINEERKTPSILNVEKLGNENAKNFKKDLAQEDGVDQKTTYPKEDGIHKAPVYPNPKDFYIEQDVDKVQKDAKTLADIEKEALSKTKGEAFNNVGDSTNEKGNEIPKRNLSKEEAYALAMNRGDGMQDIVYDNKPSDRFEKRMKSDMGDDVYKTRQDKMEFKADAPMYNKDTTPTASADKKEENNKFKKGYNSESVTGKYKDEFNKFKLVEFKLDDVEIVTTINETAFKLSLDGIGNKYSFIGKNINENVGYENIAQNYDFYLYENKVYAIEKSIETNETKTTKSKIEESKFDKMKHLMNYKPSNFVDPNNSVKF